MIPRGTFGECCQGVVDPLTLLVILTAIAGVTVFLRQVVIDNLPKKRKRSVDSQLWLGKQTILITLFGHRQSNLSLNFRLILLFL